MFDQLSADLSIAIVTGSMSRNAGGLFESVRRSAINLQKLGARVTVYALRDEYTEADLPAWGQDVTVKLFDAGWPKPLGYAPGLLKALMQDNPDIVHLHGIWLMLSKTTSTWQKRTGRPLIISPRGMLDAWALQNVGLKKKLAAALYESENIRRASAVHALNVSEANSVKAYRPGTQTAIIPNGADLPNLEETPAPPPWQSEEKKTLFFLGRLHPKKGISELLKAWKRVGELSADVHEHWQLVVGGWDDGGHAEALVNEMNALGLDNVQFPGPLFEAAKHAAFAHADAFILPSYSEGLPVSVLEAWSYKLPVFMTDACNLPIGFEAHAAKRITTDPDDIAAVLAEALRPGSEAEMAKMGSAGYQLVVDTFSWRSIAEQLIELYRWAENAEGAEAPAFLT